MRLIKPVVDAVVDMVMVVLLAAALAAGIATFAHRAFADTIIGAIPNTFTNGTTIDAAQMNANFAWVINQTNANGAKNGSNSSITFLGGLTTPPAGYGSMLYGATVVGGSGNAITLTTLIPTGFTTGMPVGTIVSFIPIANNSGATTVTINGVGPLTVLKPSPLGAVALGGGEIIATGVTTPNPVSMIYDGTEMVLLDSVAPAAAASGRGISVLNGGTPNTQLTIAGSAATMVNTHGFGISTTAFSLTNDATTNGAGGLDTGGLAANTWYYGFVITNGTALSTLISLSATAPALPSGYNFVLPIGAVARTDPTSHFLRSTKKGNMFRWTVTAATNTPNIPVLASSTSGSITAPTWSQITNDICNSGQGALPGCAVPLTAKSISLVAGSYSTGTVIVAPNTSYGGTTVGTNPPPLEIIGPNLVRFDMMLESTSLYYASTAGTNTIVGSDGFTDTFNID